MKPAYVPVLVLILDDENETTLRFPLVWRDAFMIGRQTVKAYAIDHEALNASDELKRATFGDPQYLAEYLDCAIFEGGERNGEFQNYTADLETSDPEFQSNYIRWYIEEEPGQKNPFDYERG